MADLPEWAELRGDNVHGVPIVDVDADAMYPALLSEYEAHYEDVSGPGSDEFDPEDPTAYALEVCYQTAKMDLWVALGTPTMEIRVHDSEKAWAQSDYDEGRGVDRAAGGLQGGKEAREHIKNLRGFLPA